MQVTDMILDVDDLRIPANLNQIELTPQAHGEHSDILNFVASEHSRYVQYFETPPPTTTVCSVMRDGRRIGAVLLEENPAAAESPEDAALACLVITNPLRGEGLGTRAIAACARELQSRGFKRVIAEWVASVALYERLGFRIWTIREIEDDS
jgi:GNAT superfamily N-acetyltransferase